MKKITVNKNDDAAVLAEKIITSDDQEITLLVPRFSKLAESVSNFSLLKREADAVGKTLLIESIDDQVIEAAELGGLKALNPFFAKSRRRFSDITPHDQRPSAEKKAGTEIRPASISAEHEIPDINLPPLDIHAPVRRSSGNWLKKITHPPLWVVIAAIVLGTGGWLAIVILPRADILLIAKKADWQYNNPIVGDTALAASDIDRMAVPAQIFIQKKNVEMKFTASGRKVLESKARGTITIYNAYSSESQSLVANTRFITPDGKIFRLADKIIVPAAKISEGKIVPSSIDATVIADQIGFAYNIGPVSRFTIPGFQGTPKYDGFYGVSTSAMTGGFSGEVAYPTAGDITSAKDAVAQALKKGAATDMTIQLPKGFTVLDTTGMFSVATQTVKTTVDSEGKFSVFAEAQLSYMGFKEDDVVQLLTQKARKDVGDQYNLRTSELHYGLSRVDFKAGRTSFLVDFKATLQYAVDVASLSQRVAGKRETELKSIIFGIPGLERAEFKLWPMWVSRVPNRQNRVQIRVD